MFDGFRSKTVDAGPARIFVKRPGTGMALLLLHDLP